MSRKPVKKQPEISAEALEAQNKEFTSVCQSVQRLFRDGGSGPAGSSTEQFKALCALQDQFQKTTLKPTLSSIQSKDGKTIQSSLENLLLTKVIGRTHSSSLYDLACTCLILAFKSGRSNGLNDAFTTLRALAVSKEPNERLAPLYSIGRLCVEFGRPFLAVYFEETVAILTKVYKQAKTHDQSSVNLRFTCIQCLRRVLQASGNEQLSDAYKLLNRSLVDPETSVRNEALQCFVPLLESVSDRKELDVLLGMCEKKFADQDTSVRHTAAEVCAKLLLVNIDAEAQTRQLPKEEIDRRFSRRTHRILTVEDAIGYLRGVFSQSNHSVRSSIAHSLSILFMSESRAGRDDAHLAKLVPRALEFLASKESKDFEGRRAAKSIAYALRRGVLQSMQERGLELAAKEFIQVLDAHTSKSAEKRGRVNEYQLLCSLQELGYIFNQLGEYIEDSDLKKSAVEFILPLFNDSKLWIRIHGAQCLRHLARAVPSHAATWLQTLYSVFFIHLTELDPEGAFINESDRISPVFYELHGHTYALAALVSVVPELSTGVPMHLLDQIFDGALKLLSFSCGDSSDAYYQHRRSLKEAAWLLLCAVITLGANPDVVMASRRRKSLCAAWKDSIGELPNLAQSDDKDIQTELKLRIQAFAALKAMLQIPSCTGRNKVAMIKLATAVAVKHVPFLKSISDHALNNTQSNERNPVSKYVASLRSTVADVLYLLPRMLYKTTFSKLLKEVVRDFSHLRTAPGSDLKHMLCSLDSILDPVTWVGDDKDRFAELVHKQEGALDNHTIHWSYASFPFLYNADGDTELQAELGELELASRDLGNFVRSTDSSIRLFAKLFVVQPPQHKEKLIKHLCDIQNKAKETKSVGSDFIENVAAAILGVARCLSSERKGIRSAGALQQIPKLCLDLMANPRLSVRRATAEALAIICSVEEPQFTASVCSTIGKLIQQLFVKKPANFEIPVGSALFCLGCIHRYRKNNITQEVVDATLQCLQCIGSLSSPQGRVWGVHGLSLILQAQKDSVAVMEKLTPLALNVLQSLLVQSGCLSAPTMSAIVSCVGSALYYLAPQHPPTAKSTSDVPEDSLLHDALCILRYSTQYDEGALIDNGALIDALHSLLATAPNLVDPTTLENCLFATLDHTSVSTQRKALQCMVTWASKFPDAASKQNITKTCLQHLDAATSSVARENCRKAFVALVHVMVDLHHNKPKAGLLHKVLDAVKRAIVGNHRLPSDSSMALEDEEDEEEDVADGAMITHHATEEKKVVRECRLSTKTFAVSCLELALRTLHSFDDLRRLEFDLKHARSSKYAKPVVGQLPDLITTLCQAATSSFQSLRLSGINLLRCVLQLFGECKDPEDQKELLLTLYSAQLSSSLRSLLTPQLESEAAISPALRASVCDVTALFLLSGIVKEEVVISRIYKLLVEPVHKPNAFAYWEQLYDGAVITLGRLAHLQAVARTYLQCVEYLAKHKSHKKKKKKHHDDTEHFMAILHRLVMEDQAGLLKQASLAMTDLVTVLVCSNTRLQNVKGSFFDGASCTGVKSVFHAHWTDTMALVLHELPHNEGLLSDNPAQLRQVLLATITFMLKSVVDVLYATSTPPSEATLVRSPSGTVFDHPTVVKSGSHAPERQSQLNTIRICLDAFIALLKQEKAMPASLVNISVARQVASLLRQVIVTATEHEDLALEGLHQLSQGIMRCDDLTVFLEADPVPESEIEKPEISADQMLDMDAVLNIAPVSDVDDARAQLELLYTSLYEVALCGVRHLGVLPGLDDPRLSTGPRELPANFPRCFSSVFGVVVALEAHHSKTAKPHVEDEEATPSTVAVGQAVMFLTSVMLQCVCGFESHAVDIATDFGSMLAVYTSTQGRDQARLDTQETILNCVLGVVETVISTSPGDERLPQLKALLLMLLFSSKDTDKDLVSNVLCVLETCFQHEESVVQLAAVQATQASLLGHASGKPVCPSELLQAVIVPLIDRVLASSFPTVVAASLQTLMVVLACLPEDKQSAFSTHIIPVYVGALQLAEAPKAAAAQCLMKLATSQQAVFRTVLANASDADKALISDAFRGQTAKQQAPVQEAKAASRATEAKKKDTSSAKEKKKKRKKLKARNKKAATEQPAQPAIKLGIDFKKFSS